MNTTVGNDTTQSRAFTSRGAVMDATDILFENGTGPYDLLNVEQGIRVAEPQTGNWTLRIIPFQLPAVDDLPTSATRYALAITGAVTE